MKDSFWIWKSYHRRFFRFYRFSRSNYRLKFKIKSKIQIAVFQNTAVQEEALSSTDEDFFR